MSPRTGAGAGAGRRLGSIRLSLILLALVPTVTLAAMWGLTTTQMFSEGLRLRGETELSRSTGAMGTEATLALQRERSLSAAWLADPHGSRAALDAQRRATDKAVAKVVGQTDAINRAPARVSDRLYSVVGSVSSLEYYRGQLDNPSDITAAQALDHYGAIIDDQIHAFQELSQVDDGDLTSQAGPLVALEHAAELVSQEDAQLTVAWPSGHLSRTEWSDFAELVDTRRWLVRDQIVPSLRGSAKTQTDRILQSREWQTMEDVESQVLASRPSGGAGEVALPAARKQWAAAFHKVGDQYATLIGDQTSGLLDRSAAKADNLLFKAAMLSAGGLIALLLCVGMSWRITRSLSRRLRGLREATLSLAEERLPDVVARLDRGEKVDADLATPPLDYGRDELGQVARAFNKAQRTAVHTAVELADTRRGFQKVILGIARQSQNLVNLQLTKLDALERSHFDPDVLKGLYELDSTASQLRRYEENLVIISGEQPRRSWLEPVALIDILRSAVGEVAEYQRVEVTTDEDVYLAPPAVADVIHLLAELIDNATVYSPAPAPVGVRAAMVAKGLAVEVEDRGLGLSEEDYDSFNAQLAVEPQFDVVALADDLRLGMFVIARLATRHGITVTLRPSPYGGTTAIVLLPHEIVVRESPATPAETPTPTPDLALDLDLDLDLEALSAQEEAAALEASSAQDEPAALEAPAAEEEPPAQDQPAEDEPAAQDLPPAEDEPPAQQEQSAQDEPTAEDEPAADEDQSAQDQPAPEEGPPAQQEQSVQDEPPAQDQPAEDEPAAQDLPPAEDEPTAEDEPASAEKQSAQDEPAAEDEPASDEDRSAQDESATDEEPPAQGPPAQQEPPARHESAAPAAGESTAGPAPAPQPEAASPAPAPQPEAAGPVPAPRREAAAPLLPRRVPQTSLAAELREESAGGEQNGHADEFTAERAAASLGGFQRGTLRARDDDTETQYD